MNRDSELILFPEIVTNRFLLRPLDVKDVSDRYVAWLGDPVIGQYISSAANRPTLADLKQYVLQRVFRDDVVFLGIFEKESGLHIGNIKFEPVNSELGYTIMGILIGDSNWRGKGVAAEVLIASADWLRRHRNINQIALGVSRSNVRAIAAYRKVGFVEHTTDLIPDVLAEGITMIWHLKTTRTY